MASCQNCKVMMAALKKEIEQLHEKEDRLISANEFLMKDIDQGELCSSELLEWKQKYEELVKVNQELEERIQSKKTRRKFGSDQKSNSDYQENYQSVSQFATARTRKQNMQPKVRTNSKMSEFMTAMFMDKMNYRKTSSSKNNFKRQDKRQIILRIVDDRVNRMF